MAFVTDNYIVTGLRNCFDSIEIQVYASSNWNNSSRDLEFQ